MQYNLTGANINQSLLKTRYHHLDLMIGNCLVGSAKLFIKISLNMPSELTFIFTYSFTIFTSFYDGSILCDLVNSFKNKAIDYNVSYKHFQVNYYYYMPHLFRANVFNRI